MLSQTGINRAIAINRHPAGKKGLREIEYPVINRVGLHKSQVPIKEWYYVSANDAHCVTVIHNHGNGRINCVSCL